MKKTTTALLGLAIAMTGSLYFKTAQPESIQGKVTPAWYAVNAWAISKTDTLYTTVTNGNFEFSNAQPGVYKIIVEARSPYRHMEKDNVVVKEGEPTNIGELSLQKWN
jgi:hypothetical protein